MGLLHSVATFLSALEIEGAWLMYCMLLHVYNMQYMKNTRLKVVVLRIKIEYKFS